jgi:hypothetical protein
MAQRDDFRSATKVLLARKVAYLCSICHCSTVGPTADGKKVVTTGEAAHITAAALGGPRFDVSLSQEERRDEKNGIWACAVHAKQIDSDKDCFTVERLRDYKQKAERAAFESLVRRRTNLPGVLEDLGLDVDFLKRLCLQDADIATLGPQMQSAAKTDIASYRSSPDWPSHVVTLDLSS